MDHETTNSDIRSEQSEVESARTADKEPDQTPRRPDFAVVRVKVKTGIRVGRGPDTTPS
jgi:hypothetical protein